MDLDGSNIAKLRATNSALFDNIYCRKAPPPVQPIVIKKSDVQQHVDAGKMVIHLKGNYYTTRDKHRSCGYDYLGLISATGPFEKYKPILRTYKTNHLESNSHKELKAWVLRHSLDANVGPVSRNDLLLPASMRAFYFTGVVNPDKTIEGIHSKKTVISNADKVHTAEVPDYVKTLLNASSAKRLINRGKGTRLLECCKVDKDMFLSYCVKNYGRYEDMQPLTVEDISTHINTEEVDHRVYGKALEDFIGACVCVFDIDGLVPYRCSNCEKERFVLLYMSESYYDRIVVSKGCDVSKELLHLRTLLNNATRVRYNYECKDALLEERPVDYTFVYLRLIGYFAQRMLERSFSVVYVRIPECDCKDIVESVYRKNVYYEGVVRCIGARYSKGTVVVRKRECVIAVTVDMLLSVFERFVQSCESVNDKNTVRVYSPVDMSKYHKWNFLLEDCLYYSPQCYSLGSKEEVQYVQLQQRSLS
jgi:hypothetical protein